MAVGDPTFLETHLLKHGAGNPRTLLRMVNRLRRAPAITPQVVRWAHVPGTRPQFGLTPVLLTSVLVPGMTYYFVPDLEYTAVFILTGIA